MQMPVLKRFSLASLGAHAVLVMLATALSACAVAQETEADVEDAPGPGRVARLSYTQGGVTLQGVGETVWAPANVNRPMGPGDYLRTDSDGRAELQVGTSVVRLGNDSNFSFLALDERALRMRVSVGVINLRVRDLAEDDVIEIETPQATASILRPGNYRLEVSGTGNATVVKVSNGVLEARGGGDQSFVVRTQQVTTITGTTRLASSTMSLGAPDSFDEWSLERDQRLESARDADSAKYVSNDVVGYEDLDEYGSWRNEPDYGYVWTPTRVVSGWSPYRFGRYTYVSGWGWTWIEDSPWGFAPYNYGNWVTIGGRWSWVPGPRHGHSRGGGRPGYGYPGRPSHDWHTPRPPRGSTANNTPPAGVDNPRNGYRYLRPETPGNGGSQPGGSAAPVTPSTAPADDRRMRIPRYEMPRQQRQSTYPRNDSAGQPAPSGGVQQAPGGRAIRPMPQPRVEQPRREMSRPEAARQSAPPPSPPPQQQQSTRSDGGERPSGRGGAERRGGGNSTRER